MGTNDIGKEGSDLRAKRVTSVRLPVFVRRYLACHNRIHYRKIRSNRDAVEQQEAEQRRPQWQFVVEVSRFQCLRQMAILAAPEAAARFCLCGTKVAYGAGKRAIGRPNTIPLFWALE